MKSKNGVVFRKWVTKVLKDYMLKGYAVDQKWLEYLEKTVKLIDIASRVVKELKGSDTMEIIRVISDYSKGLGLLDDYNHKTSKKVEGTVSSKKITYKDCKELIEKLSFNNDSNLFAMDSDNGLETILGSIYQIFGGIDVYKSLEEKVSNLLYMVVKNHVFIDSNI